MATVTAVCDSFELLFLWLLAPLEIDTLNPQRPTVPSVMTPHKLRRWPAGAGDQAPPTLLANVDKPFLAGAGRSIAERSVVVFGRAELPLHAPWPPARSPVSSSNRHEARYALRTALRSRTGVVTAREIRLMRVIVLGSGVIGVTSAYYLAEAGHEVVVLDRQEGPALETSFANAGEVSPGYCLALGRAGHPDQGAEVAVHAPSPAVHLAQARPGPDPLGPDDAPQLHGRPLRAQQGPDGAAGRVQPRPAARAAGRARHRL